MVESVILLCGFVIIEVGFNRVDKAAEHSRYLIKSHHAKHAAALLACLHPGVIAGFDHFAIKLAEELVKHIH